jgi:hypothetical protein
LHVAWEQWDGFRRFVRLWRSVYPQLVDVAPLAIGGQMSEPERGIFGVDVDISLSGQMVVGWYEKDFRTGERAIWANSVDKNDDEWDVPHRVAISSGADPQPRVAVSRSGSAVIVWVSEGHIWASTFVDAKGWSEAIQIERNEGFASIPDVVTDCAGNWVVAWNQRDMDEEVGFFVYVASYRVGNGWEQPVLLSAPGEHGLSPKLASNCSGGTVGIWAPDIVP